MKKTLTAKILVIFILVSLAAVMLPHVQAQTGQAQVISYSWYIAPTSTTTAQYSNDLIAVGEVKNIGSSVIGAIWVRGEAHDSSGTVLAVTQAQVMASNLAPNQKAPFYLDFTPDGSITGDQSWVSNVTSVAVTIATTTNPIGTGSQYGGLVVQNQNGANNNGTYIASGTITNFGDQSVGDVAVVTTFYNSSGIVVAASFIDLGTALTPGQSTPFSAAPFDNTADLSNQIANYTVLLQSIISNPTPTPEPTAVTTPHPTIQPTNTPLPTAPTGTAQTMELVYIAVIAIAVIVAIIIVVMLLKSRGSPGSQTTAPQPAP